MNLNTHCRCGATLRAHLPAGIPDDVDLADVEAVCPAAYALSGGQVTNPFIPARVA